MTALRSALRLAVTALSDIDAPFAIIGGLAVSAWVEPRATRDVDVAVSVSGDAGAESVVYALRRSGYEVVASMDHLPTGRLGTVRMCSARTGDVLTDLLFASSGIEPEIATAAKVRALLPGLFAPVAVPGHLVAMKLLARDDRARWRDAQDLSALRPILSAADVDLARESVRLITERGFARDRDLIGLLETYLAAPPT